jgi:K+-transporting ATPase ATPase C chain
MSRKNGVGHVIQEAAASGRIVLATLAVCCLLYGSAVWAFAWAVAPVRAEGSLLRDGSGRVRGSELIAQAFTRPEYVWPRPSACGYNAASAGGSNLSPASPALRERAQTLVAKLGADGGRRLPADLAAASGSGLDPHITRAAADFHAGRVAQRGKQYPFPQRRSLSLWCFGSRSLWTHAAQDDASPGDRNGRDHL